MNKFKKKLNGPKFLNKFKVFANQFYKIKQTSYLSQIFVVVFSLILFKIGEIVDFFYPTEHL